MLAKSNVFILEHPNRVTGKWPWQQSDGKSHILIPENDKDINEMSTCVPRIHCIHAMFVHGLLMYRVDNNFVINNY